LNILIVKTTEVPVTNPALALLKVQVEAAADAVVQTTLLPHNTDHFVFLRLASAVTLTGVVARETVVLPPD
jgi:hypothetical protein